MYKFMKKFFIGVDVSKDTVDVSFFDDDRMKSPEYLAQYSNSPKGFREMVKDLRTEYESGNPQSVFDVLPRCQQRAVAVLLRDHGSVRPPSVPLAC
mgnify:CR=1 FL=1